MQTIYSVKQPLGRIMLARLTSLASVADAEKYRAEVRQAVLACKPTAIICADWCLATTVAPDIAEILVSMLTTVNAHIERSGILLAPEHAAFNLQAERLVKEGNLPSRRTFRHPKLMFNWLAPLLTNQEQTAVSDFLSISTP